MSEMTPIKYMGFYDVPLIFLTRYRGTNYLFDCPFNEELEDDSDFYKVYVVPELKDEELSKDWTTLHRLATRYLGEVPVASVHFDASRRKCVDASIINELVERRVTAG
jgi:hypothetical protein